MLTRTPQGRHGLLSPAGKTWPYWLGGMCTVSPRLFHHCTTCPGGHRDHTRRAVGDSQLCHPTRYAAFPSLLSTTHVFGPGFLLYCLTVLVFSLVMIYYVSPLRHAEPIGIHPHPFPRRPHFPRGFGIALKLTISGKNQLTHASTYVFAVVIVVCILVQMNYLNKALDTCSTNVCVLAPRH